MNIRLAFVCAACWLTLAGVQLHAQVTERVSLASNGAQGNNESLASSMTPDGRYVLFTSWADNLVPQDTNFAPDVFLRDRVTGTTTRINVDSNGQESHGNVPITYSRWRTISDDGRFVVFISDAPDLVAVDTNLLADAFVRDTLLGVTQRVSLASGGAQSNTGVSRDASLSADGRYVGFVSGADDLVPNDTNFQNDVFVHDRSTQQTIRASLAADGSEVFENSEGVVSGNGRFVVFWSRGVFVANDGNNRSDVFVRDLQLGSTERISLGMGGADADDESLDGAISDDGRFVAFDSASTNLIPGDTNGAPDVFLRDRMTGTTTRVNVATGGIASVGSATRPSLSADGSHVVFLSFAPDLVAGDQNNDWDFFLHSRASGTTTRVNLNSCGHESVGFFNLNALSSYVTPNGRHVLFGSARPNLVPNDTNIRIDVFVRDFTATAPFPVCAHCSAGTSTQGCRAHLATSGVPSASSTSGFALSLSGVDGQRSAAFFYGLSGATWTPPWTSGTASVRCVKAPFQRTLPQSSSGSAGQCDGTLMLDWLTFVATFPGVLGAPPQPGAVVNVQGWVRDPSAPGATQFSDAVEFTIVP